LQLRNFNQKVYSKKYNLSKLSNIQIPNPEEITSGADDLEVEFNLYACGIDKNIKEEYKVRYPKNFFF